MEELVKEFVEVSAAEAAAKERRRELATLIAAELPGPDEGSKTHGVGDYKVTVKRSMIRRVVDWDAFEAIPAKHRPVRVKTELDPQGLKWFAEYEPETYQKYLELIESKPGAIQVAVKS